MNFPSSFKEKTFVFIAIILIGFGTWNLAQNGFAQQTEIQQDDDFSKKIAFIIIERLLAEVGPIVGGAVMIGTQFARKKGLAISAEAEEYFVKSTSSFVADQSRWIYEQLRDNKEHWYALDAKQNQKSHEGGLPKSLGQEAKKRVIDSLIIELKSDEFTKKTASLLRENIVPLVERMVTENNRQLTSRGRQMIFELAPIAVEAAILPFKTRQEIYEKIESITDAALISIKKSFDFEEVAFDENLAKMTVKAELQKKTASQT
ncbi:MAG: hypothetical protein ACT4NT_08155 [Nitrososphaerota archaeon]